MATLSPDFEVIVHPPTESFRWNVHGYPHHLAKWHYHPEYELHLTQDTCGRMMIGDYVGPFSPGCLILTGPNLPHNWVSDVAPDYRSPDRDMLIQFSSEFAERMCDCFAELHAVKVLLDDSVYGVEFSGTAQAEGARLLQEIGDVSGVKRMMLFLELMDVLSRSPSERRILSHSAPALNVHTVRSKKLQVAITHIYENYTQGVRLDEVARLVHMEPSTFSRFFKKQTGHTFSKFINKLRVHHACNLLVNTDISMTEICYDAGFNNTANFNRQFNTIYRETPSSYRKSARSIARADRDKKKT
ncbi:AraC family transcriptional regulator [Hoeflea sp. YIM 152468]|uniref:AraC family transcriptional regulator n=1 Tax=Hoeflea sp. YIM 152468 TaxID=3031759 RepID=UPI0023D99566|nr:AraC family transcriptional regulator [Hoeflea sp. YIM 152468]MDF1608657.1 AraC family transcriptional regulator [Hoeflea sp. YIM 152468]